MRNSSLILENRQKGMTPRKLSSPLRSSSPEKSGVPETIQRACAESASRSTARPSPREGRLKIGQARFRDDYAPVDAACDGFVSTNYSRAYLHHLWRANEPVVHGLLTLHNIKFMADLMAELRAAILRDEL